ncbi:carboxypeptidase-like regulatory domain-containing protein [Terrimonas sp. NA20]|uniref:Carboxypeptidase-like regulatory domain-containing protein n=1 Tax=Terrimonas ginsenosidimutans TaxID=2908004 RepID=A0ABS9KUL9_9BACT|nr:carboxypeptidase-like regulatory domain-containing protein [Terrimonas ginsenosidimutans]MCG2616026.1 carboxypeptidase-like regulatory domain-containing protein [Terrimonas ginsenosidimutans]
MKTSLRSAGKILLFIVLLSCSKKDKGSGGGEEPQKGYASGKITNADGSPWPGVKVIVENTLFYNTYVAAVSDEKGAYKVKLPSSGTYHATADIEKTYNGKKYTLRLHPDNDDPFGTNGAVRNFTFKLTGAYPDGLGYYGGTVIVDKDVMSELYDSENVELTLTPVGKLIDGSQGQTLKLRPGQPRTDNYGKLVDVPIGRYNVSAVHISGSTRRPLKLQNRVSDGPFESVLQIDFEPSIIWGNNIAALGYKE